MKTDIQLIDNKTDFEPLMPQNKTDIMFEQLD